MAEMLRWGQLFVTENQNNKTGALASLLNKLDLPTLLMVLVMGGGNLFITKEDGRLTRGEAEQVAREVHALHGALDEFEQRQKDTLGKLGAVLEAQGIDNANQTKLLESQTKMLEELRGWQEEFKNR